MKFNNDVVQAIGNTPLIKLKRASELTGCTILGKAEFMNPGQSVKDRAGKWMILEAEKRGDLKPGGLVVEATAGNTGIGLAVVASARGYRTLIVIPETQSQEKKDMLRLCGAELVEVPALPYSNPNNYQHIARRLADQLRKNEKNGVLFADQCGAAMYSLFTKGEAKASEGGSITEGIGLGRVTPIIDDIKVDKAYLIPDEEAVPIIFDLLEHEGLCLGGSSGINIAGAIRLAKDLGPGKTIVTMLCDGGSRYQSKLFNPEFLRSKNLPVPEWLEKKSNIEIPFEKA